MRAPSLLCIALATCSAAVAAAEAPPGAKVEAQAATRIQVREVDGSLQKLQEYREAKKGFLLDQLRLELGETERTYLQFRAEDALQEDERYRLSAGRHGKFRLTGEYGAIPHNFSSGRLLFGGFGQSELGIAEVARGQLQENEQTQAERGPGRCTWLAGAPGSRPVTASPIGAPRPTCKGPPGRTRRRGGW